MKTTNLFKSMASAQKYKKKETVTSDEFIDAMEADFDRKLDVNSAFFFRHHLVSVNLLHRILTGQISASGTEADSLVITTFISDMTEYLVNTSESELEKINESDRISDRFTYTLEAFSKTYPDAGNVIGQAINAYFNP